MSGSDRRSALTTYTYKLRPPPIFSRPGVHVYPVHPLATPVPDISLLSGAILVKLGRNIHCVSYRC